MISAAKMCGINIGQQETNLILERTFYTLFCSKCMQQMFAVNISLASIPDFFPTKLVKKCTFHSRCSTTSSSDDIAVNNLIFIFEKSAKA